MSILSDVSKAGSFNEINEWFVAAIAMLDQEEIFPGTYQNSKILVVYANYVTDLKHLIANPGPLPEGGGFILRIKSTPEISRSAVKRIFKLANIMAITMDDHGFYFTHQTLIFDEHFPNLAVMRKLQGLGSVHIAQ